MKDKDQKMLFESYEIVMERQFYTNILLKEGYTHNQINDIIQTEGWDGVKKFTRRFAPAALGAMSLANSAMAADNNNTVNPNDPNQYRDNRPAAVEVVKKDQSSLQDKLYDAIIHSTKGFSVNKETLIRAIHTPEDAEKFLSAMTPKQRQTSMNVYGVEASKTALSKSEYNRLLTGNTGATTVGKNIYFGQRILNEPKEELLGNLSHELQHASDNVQYPMNEPDFDNKSLGWSQTGTDSNAQTSVAKINSNSIYAKNSAGSYKKGTGGTYISPKEIRGRIAGSRSYLGVVSTPEQFKQVWDNAQKEYNNTSRKDWFNDTIQQKIPVGMRQLIDIYNTSMDSKQDQQKLYNYIQRTVLDNSVAQNNQGSSKNIV